MATPEYKIITAQYNGQCSVCGNGIQRGQKIKYAKGCPTLHADCEMPEIPADAIHLSQGSGYGCHGWQPGTVIKNPDRRNGSSQSRLGQRFSKLTGMNSHWAGAYAGDNQEARDLVEQLKSTPADDGPEFLYVITSSARYVREDGMSFGVGDESGYLYDAVCRPATDEESRPLREAITAAQAGKEAASQLKDIINTIVRETGEYPEGEHSPEGERVNFGPGQNLYGGGSWFVIGPEWIWYVMNNGADGDDWSVNNVRTGGAGAIGRRVPFTQDLAERIKTLATTAFGNNA